MKTCLNQFHQSAFDDGISPARNLNIGLTSSSLVKYSMEACSEVCSVGGGGSKSKDRQTKLEAKNEKLREVREWRALNETSAKETIGGSLKETHRQTSVILAGELGLDL